MNLGLNSGERAGSVVPGMVPVDSLFVVSEEQMGGSGVGFSGQSRDSIPLPALLVRRLDWLRRLKSDSTNTAAVGQTELR